MNSFSTIKIKSKTAERFRKYSKKIAKSHSEALESMLLFFQTNSLSPYETFGPSGQTLESLIKKRINGLVAILKSIEKEQTLPTKSMMQLLFEGNPTKKKEILVERKKDQDDLVTRDLGSLNNPQYNKNEITRLTSRNETLKKDIYRIVSKGQFIKTTFGKDYYKVEVSTTDWNKIKSNL